VDEASILLTAEWRHIVFLSYAIDPARLLPRVPPGTEIDDLRGTALVSFVGLRVLNPRVLGLPVPLHREFEQVNLRYYVRRRAPEGWRRGVAFVREIVPRRAIAFAARRLYGERCSAMPMRHVIEAQDGRVGPGGAIEYGFKHAGRWNRLGARVAGAPRPPFPGSVEEFVTEHYWGYTAREAGETSEFQVEHPPWEVLPVSETWLDCEVGAVYGRDFEEAVRTAPASAFVAEGSAVAVHRGARLS
jgi:hypothetical protein